MALLIATLKFNKKQVRYIQQLLRRKKELERRKKQKSVGKAQNLYQLEFVALKWVLESLQDATIVDDYFYEFKKKKDY